ncbi:MAG: ATP-binding protein [Synergistaceae bacterium]|nr:ATP-binding protein [Synergistaceae bacterium]
MPVQRIDRREYIDKLAAFKDKQVIKIISGVRRCGKSTLMEMFQDRLREQGILEERIVSINLEDYDLHELRDPGKLHAYVKERLARDGTTYIFIDEIQHCADFHRALDSLYIKKGTDIYVTGSNASMLSGELATLISGRYVEVRMLPLSFKEHVLAVGDSGALSRSYAEYLEGSSFPYALEFRGRPDEVRDYLEGIYNTIVVKDIAARKRISDIMMLESVTRFVFDNTGNPLSTKKIADALSSGGRKADVKTVERYLEGLMESFVIYQARRYDIRGKQHLKTLGKYYVVDHGMRSMLLGTSSADVGRVLENVVYLESLRRGYQVYVGKVDELEVDLVLRGRRGMAYIQVAASVRDPGTLARELAPLKRIADNYPKAILTLDEDPEADYEGIRRANALEWLMGKVEL